MRSIPGKAGFKTCMLGVSLLLLLIVRADADETMAYKVAGDSMSPALMSGDTIIVSADRIEPLRRGDLVAIRFKHTITPMVKRIRAVEGDRIEIKKNALIVNGEKIREIDMAHWQPTIKQLERYGWIVPAKNIFVLGDNPDNSLDSRRLGLISTDHVEGRVTEIRTE